MGKSNKSYKTNVMSVDEIYLRVWEKQQDRVGTNWSIIIFFLSVSFAMFGLSFQGQNLLIVSRIQRITGFVIYWFTYFLFQRHNDWSKFLRAYLEELETTAQPRITLHTRWKKIMQKPFRKWTSVTKLLWYSGLLYMIAVVLLWRLGI